MDAAARQQIRQAQDEHEALYDALQATLSAAEWQALIAFNTYCAHKCGLRLDLYRRDTGTPAYRFRPMTPAEIQDWAEGRVEDQL
jgi:hypothetical protein